MVRLGHVNTPVTQSVMRFCRTKSLKFSTIFIMYKYRSTFPFSENQIYDMGQEGSYLKVLCVILAGLINFLDITGASHFRGGLITWAPVYNKSNQV